MSALRILHRFANETFFRFLAADVSPVQEETKTDAFVNTTYVVITQFGGNAQRRGAGYKKMAQSFSALNRLNERVSVNFATTRKTCLVMETMGASARVKVVVLCVFPSSGSGMCRDEQSRDGL
jgi:hypothetical protein